jgi:hypothetical protein
MLGTLTRKNTTLPPALSPDEIQTLLRRNATPEIQTTRTLVAPLPSAPSVSRLDAYLARVSPLASSPQTTASPLPSMPLVQNASQMDETPPPVVMPPTQMLNRQPQFAPNPPTLDASSIKSEDRWNAVENADRSTPAPQGNNITMSTPFDRAASSSPSNLPTLSPRANPVTPDNHMKRINELLGQLDKLESVPDAKDKNGRWKSSLLGALHGALMELATGGIGGALGGGAAGLVRGAVQPGWDERIKQHAEIARQQGHAAQALAIEKELSGIQNTQAETAKKLSDATPTEEKQRAALVKELNARMRITGGKLNPGKDPRQGDIAAQLGISTAFGGAKFNPQGLRTIRGADGVDRLIYASMEGGELGARYIDVAGNAGGNLSERDTKQLALELERENLNRSKSGLAPIGFADDGEAAGASSTPQTPTRPTPLAPVPAGDAPAPLPQSSPTVPAPAAVPARRPSGMVLSGAQPEPVTRQSYGGSYRRGGFHRGGGGYRSSGGGGVDAKGEQIVNGQMQSTLRDIEENKSMAEAAARKGDTQAASDYLSHANALAQTLQTNPNFKGRVEVGSSPDGQGRAWPYVKIKERAQPARATRGAQTKVDPLGLFQ